MTPLLVAGGVVAFVLLVVIVMYNGLVAKKNQVENAFAGIDAILKKRFDLVPNLVAVVKQYMQHEAETLTNIAKIRSQAQAGPPGSDARLAAENQLTKAIGSVLVAVENYPDLKASANFLGLQASLNEIEEQLSASRRFYNSAVVDLNNAIQMFPSSIMASMMKLTRRELFSVPEAERQNVNVGNLFKA
jgi:LemA protein